MNNLRNSKTLKRKDFLTLLGNARTAAKRKYIIDNCSTDDIDAVSESCNNLLSNNIKLSKRQYNSLKKHKTDIRKVAKPNIEHKTKKKILTQRGGFLNILLPLAVEAIIGLIKHKKKKK